MRKTDRINELVGAWVIQSGNSKRKLAELLGISKPTLNARITGQTDWKWSEVCRLADILGVPLGAFVGTE